VSVEAHRATPEDISALAPLFDAYRVLYGQEPDPDLASRFLRERLERAESVVFLALDGKPEGRPALRSFIRSSRRWPPGTSGCSTTCSSRPKPG
jgi:hypothetical protein